MIYRRDSIGDSLVVASQTLLLLWFLLSSKWAAVTWQPALAIDIVSPGESKFHLLIDGAEWMCSVYRHDSIYSRAMNALCCDVHHLENHRRRERKCNEMPWIRKWLADGERRTKIHRESQDSNSNKKWRNFTRHEIYLLTLIWICRHHRILTPSHHNNNRPQNTIVTVSNRFFRLTSLPQHEIAVISRADQ